MTNEHPVVSKEEWLAARRALLVREKALTREADAIAAARRALPRVRLAKEYVFDAAGGWRSLADLFEGASQLIVYHFMLAPGAREGCVACSFSADHFDGAVPHLRARDVSFAAVSRAPVADIEAFRRRMGWRFTWVSSHASDFDRDFDVWFPDEQRVNGKGFYNYEWRDLPGADMPGVTVFLMDERGDIFHTYSAFARGCEPLIGTYALLDLVPKGRGEAELTPPMAWVRHRDRYPQKAGGG